MSNASVFKPKSKRRKMRRFVLDEISVVDTPAQKGAVVTIMKRGDMAINPKGTEMTLVQKLQRQMAVLDAKLSAILKAGPDEYEVYPKGQGEFQKPEDYEDEDEDEIEKERVYRPGRTAAEHRGDWPPGSGTPGPGARPPKGTRADGHVSGDERGGEMTPERASQVLQPYADHSIAPEEDDPNTESDALWSRLEDEEDMDEEEMDEEMRSRIAAKADSLMKRDPRMSPTRAHMMAIERVASEAVAEADTFAKRNGEQPMARPLFGRELEYQKRADAAAQAKAHVRKGYSDAELFERLEKRFGPGAAERAVRQYGGR
jgi:hypothetical protein